MISYVNFNRLLRSWRIPCPTREMVSVSVSRNTATISAWDPPSPAVPWPKGLFSIRCPLKSTSLGSHPQLPQTWRDPRRPTFPSDPTPLWYPALWQQLSLVLWLPGLVLPQETAGSHKGPSFPFCVPAGWYGTWYTAGIPETFDKRRTYHSNCFKTNSLCG